MSTQSQAEAATAPRDRVVAHLRRQWVGPAGDDSEVLSRSPIYAYLVGILYPSEVGTAQPRAELLEVETGETAVDLESTDPTDPGVEDIDDNDEPAEEDSGLNLTGAFGWAPQSVGMSFIHDGTDVVFSLRAGIYAKSASDKPATVAAVESTPKATQDAADDGSTDSNPPNESWSRQQLLESEVVLPNEANGSIAALGGRATVSWRTRIISNKRLVTVAISNAKTVGVGLAKSDPSQCLFQVELECSIRAGHLQPYPISNPLSTSAEDRELELRYRDKLSYGIGHGTAVTWDTKITEPVTLSTESLPTQEVAAIRPKQGSDRVLDLAWLADETVPTVDLAVALREFAADYSTWLHQQEQTASSFTVARSKKSASDIVDRAKVASARIEDGIRLLEKGGNVLAAFRLANLAMRDQMLQQALSSTHPGVIDEPLTQRDNGYAEPRWRPFQLGFMLLSLPSTTIATHEDRELVDLIWFPTGGGKTEAYLGLAATEMIRRRLDDGVRGGGTAVITRYTMRLLTAQQFQRASTLICSLELLRKSEPRLKGSPAFTIGLWLGNTTTPATFKKAASDMKAAYKDAVPENTFQLRECPWCATPIFPKRRTARVERYGVLASNYDFSFFCPHPDCPFHDHLPVNVVDEAIYASPPSMLVATVDKFARLAWIDKGAGLFGLGGVPFNPPSLVIQDELHLITGPLGTIVGVYEAAIRGLMAWAGRPPKTIASTATIRSAEEQVRGLMATRVAVFPPSGLDADDNYFAEPDPDSPGRLYVGIMPQAHTPSWALGQISSELLEAPVTLELEGPARDAYWTLVVYHNSLRELGRTVTILRDDVRSELDRRRNESDKPVRKMARDGVEELNGNVKADELLRILDQLAVGPDEEASAIDALATTNIMSVGIDVGRLGLMLVNGQPKATSEYIQATSRVGRGKTPGLVVTMFRSGKPRDRSVFESFGTFHRSYYRFVEPSSVTPWSLQARRRALRAALVILMRHGAGLTGNDQAKWFEATSAGTTKSVDLLMKHVGIADNREAKVVRDELDRAVDDWSRRAQSALDEGTAFAYRSREHSERLLKQFTDEGPGWPAMNSMRSVDRVIRVRADGERR